MKSSDKIYNNQERFTFGLAQVGGCALQKEGDDAHGRF
jgi:hypothetical protein